jgi:aminocarboxymuconate-semialdehyde decarboxylase
MKTLVVDVHAHYVPQLAFDRFEANAAKFPGITLARDGKTNRMQFPGTEMTRPINPKLTDLAERVRWMDEKGIDHQMLGLWTDLEGYELPPEQGLAWSRFINDCAWEELRDQPRFTPLASVPLQDGKLAAEVLGEAMERGFGGAMIGTQPKGIQGGNLDDPSLDPFWEMASKTNAALFLHPMFVCGEPRLEDYELVNAAGRLADSTIAVSRLLYSGHLLRFPGAKLVMAHGGAAIPFAMGRLGRNNDAFPNKFADARKGFEMLFFDSCVFEPAALEYICKRSSPEKVMLGSDIPFHIGDPDPVKVVEGAYLRHADRQAILGGNAQRIFRVRKDCWCRS